MSANVLQTWASSKQKLMATEMAITESVSPLAIVESVSPFQGDGPSFFKITIGCQAEELQIPPHFKKYMSSDWLDTVVLTGPSGNHWYVKVGKNESGVFLQDGWNKFLNDHSLGNSEFLLFHYYGKMHFRVRIFGRSGLERFDFPTTSKNQADASDDPE